MHARAARRHTQQSMCDGGDIGMRGRFHMCMPSSLRASSGMNSMNALNGTNGMNSMVWAAWAAHAVWAAFNCPMPIIELPVINLPVIMPSRHAVVIRVVR
jgi:hypothetical protein